jgi:hypothetical protein
MKEARLIMARTADATSNILLQIYDEKFKGDSMESYRISWPQLRAIAGTPKLDGQYLSAVNETLLDDRYTLIPLDDLIVVAHESDFQSYRQVPDRIVENYIVAGIDAPAAAEVDDELERR